MKHRINLTSAVPALCGILLYAACSDSLPAARSKSADFNTTATAQKPALLFLAHVPGSVRLPDLSDAVNLHLLGDYGAVFVAQGVTVPPALIFSAAADVDQWQASVKSERARIRGIEVDLQSPALKALLEACEEGKKSRVVITPRTRDAARRSYEWTVVLWERRIDAGLKHWLAKGKITPAEAKRLRGLAPHEQIIEIQKLESKGLFFSQLFNKSILDSAAPPGASQHLSMLAIDIKEHTEPKVRAILARHEWFQTVACDLPHFTYLGVPENRLPSLGLEKVTCAKRPFWVPDLGAEAAQERH